MTKKTALIILDGWGIGDGTKSDAIRAAATPFVDSLYINSPHATLRTDGLEVGLPEGQMGNSEVGHLNIGAGRVVFQDLVRINLACADGSLLKNETLVKAFADAKQNKRKVHFLGLLSDGGIHSHQTHLHTLCEAATLAGLEDVFVHAFTDGRDTDPKAGAGYINKLENFLENQSAQLASVIGRYYAMDRDKRWERIKEAYDLMVHGRGTVVDDFQKAVKDSYAAAITDEFVKPMLKHENGKPLARIDAGDLVICFNFRTDRCREITMALSQIDMPEYAMSKLPLKYITMCKYDESFKGVEVLFSKDNLKNTLGEVLAKAGKSQVRMAETEKYPHVTFFFSGGREEAFENEHRILVNSPKVATYDLQPEMSAPELADALCKFMKSDAPDFVCLNFANADMVGHTGDYDAVLEAVETVDKCLKQVVDAGTPLGYNFLVIADHGNSDKMINADGTPNTAHTTNPVPVFLLNAANKRLQDGRLADVAPTILELLEVDQPEEMTGKSLLA